MRKLSYTARIHLPSSKTYQHIIQTLSFTSRFSTEKVRSMAQLNKPHGQINLSMQQLSQRLLLLFMDYGGKKTKAARQSCDCRNTFLPLRSKKDMPPMKMIIKCNNLRFTSRCGMPYTSPRFLLVLGTGRARDNFVPNAPRFRLVRGCNLV